MEHLNASFLIVEEEKVSLGLGEKFEPKEEQDDAFHAGNEIANSCNSPKKEPKEEPLDDFICMPAENEFLGAVDQSGNDDISPLFLVEPKSEVIEDAVVFPLENVLNLPPPSSPVKDEPIVDEYIQDLVRFGQIPAWDAALDQSARYNVNKGNIGTAKCVRCESYPLGVYQYVDHLKKHHESILDMNRIYLRCSCGHEVRCSKTDFYHTTNNSMTMCDGLSFTLHELGGQMHWRMEDKLIPQRAVSPITILRPSSPQCILCDRNSRKFTLHKMEEKPLITVNRKFTSIDRPQSNFIDTQQKKPNKVYKKSDTEMKCIKCEYITRSVSALVSHLSVDHSTTIRQAVIVFRCECGHESQSHSHSRRCNIANFTVLRKEYKPIKKC